MSVTHRPTVVPRRSKAVGQRADRAGTGRRHCREFCLFEAAAENGTDGGEFNPQSAETVETEILGEDLSVEQLNEEYPL